MRPTTSLLALCVLSLVACAPSGEDASDTSGAASAGPGDTPPAAPAAPASTPTPTPAPSASTPQPAPPAPDRGALFTITNALDANAVTAFLRDENGMLSAAASYPTGGKGTAKGLGSQGAVALSDDGRFLVVVDPGSNEITSFAVDGTKLELRARVSSGGVMPVSVAVRGNLVYALNAGDTSCIAGFRMDANGALTAIPDSTRGLSAPSVGAAQVAFDPKGDALVVTEKATNVIDTFVIHADGTPSYGMALPSSGKTPFGFAFTPKGHLVVSEAFGGMAGAGAASSYTLASPAPNAEGELERDLDVVSASVPDQRSAPCWFAITSDGAWAFTTNTASDDVSAYHVGTDGSLMLVGDGVAATTGTGSKPIDLSFDRSTRHLYVLGAGTHEITELEVGKDGTLTKRGSIAAPMTAAGLAGY